MKILNIVPGFGGTFYCGNCLRDSVYTKTLKQLGHDVVILPIYLPLSNVDLNKTENEIPVFYGAVNIYLKQNFKLFRNMPKWMYRFFDSYRILKFAAKKAGSTRAEGLEDMTISMLKGVDGYQKEELEKLCNYIKYQNKPDIIHLSNALLLGLASKLRNELSIPIVCSLQDEDVWVDAMRDGYRQQIWQLMNQNVKNVDAFIAVSDFFAKLMKDKMNIPDNKLHVVPIGINPDLYKMHEPSFTPIIIGFLSRMCEENGFEILIDAFIKLKQKEVFANARLRLTGGKTGDDLFFIKKQLSKLKKHKMLDSVDFYDDFRTEQLSSFFNGLTVLSVPVLKGEAFGMYQLESLASGIPLVQPNLGAFPEIASITNGEEIYSPNTADALYNALFKLLLNKEKLSKMSKDGREAVEKKFNTQILSKKMIEIYTEISN